MTQQNESADGVVTAPAVGLGRIAREWGRIGIIGFGGPPAHIALLRRLCVEQRRWIAAGEFEDAVAACSLLPGPASTQLAIWCGWRLRRRAGAVVAGVCFIAPGFAVILVLSALFLAAHPPLVVLGAAAGAGAAVPAVAVHAAWGLLPASRQRIQIPAPAHLTGSAHTRSGDTRSADTRSGDPRSAHTRSGDTPFAGNRSAHLRSTHPRSAHARSARARWIGYALVGGAAAALVGPFLVLILIGCGLAEVLVRTRPATAVHSLPPLALPAAAAAANGGLAALAWVAFKVGALSYGGGFVIIPLMQHDAVPTYHWMTNAQFLDAVALGQVTPGPVVLTTSVVGFAAAGYAGALLALCVAFSPSFAFVLLGARHFDALRRNDRVQAFLTGAGPAVIGAIAGSAIPLALALTHGWQYALLPAAALWLLAARRGVVSTLLLAAACGVALALLGVSVT